jgi:hypothetical protein
MENMMPKAKTESRLVAAHHEIELNRFELGFDYRLRDNLQVRLDGLDTIYLCYTEKEGREVTSISVPFPSFLEAFKRMVDILVIESRAAKVTNEEVDAFFEEISQPGRVPLCEDWGNNG